MDKASKYVMLYEQLKQDIVSGNVDYDQPLPSIRESSSTLKLSRTTVERAYSQLLLEGYVYSVQGVGYFANMLSENPNVIGDNDFLEKHAPSTSKHQKVYDFLWEYADEDAIDLSMLKRHLNHVMNNHQKTLLAPQHICGADELRIRIANYIQMARDIKVHPSQIIIGAGISNLLTNLIPVISGQVDGLAIEDPGFKPVRDVFSLADFPITPIPLTEEGVDMAYVRHFKRHICYVSPAHQFPTGNVMQIANRQSLVSWANETDSYILEDDYNASLRYELFPISSLKSMDYHDRVIYLGSFSTYLIPGIRISYMILPRHLHQDYVSRGFPQTASLVEQLAFAHMIETGDYQRHINRMRKYYKKKTELVHHLLEQYLHGMHIIKNKSGLNVMVVVADDLGVSEEGLIQAMAEKGVWLRTLNEMVVQFKQPPTILLNYKGIPIKDLEPGIRLIGEVLDGLLVPKKTL